MYRTIPVKAKFTEDEKAFWVDQCEHANSLINCAIYHLRQTHYGQLERQENAFTIYWRGDELRYGWKTYKCKISYPELDKVLKDNSHYKVMAAQSAQQTLKSVGEGSIPFLQKYTHRLEAWGYTSEVRLRGLNISLRRQALFV